MFVNARCEVAVRGEVAVQCEVAVAVRHMRSLTCRMPLDGFAVGLHLILLPLGGHRVVLCVQLIF